MARFCSNCGKELKDEERFCSECGAPVEQAENAQPADQMNAVVPQEQLPQQPIQQQNYGQQPPYQQQFASAPAPHGPMDRISFITVVLLSIVTCGIYGIYWMITFADKVHTLVGRQTAASGVKLLLYSILSCGIYVFYFYVEMGNSLNEAHDQRGMYGHRLSQGVTVVLMLFGLAIIPMYQLIQSYNEVVDFDNGQWQQ